MDEKGRKNSIYKEESSGKLRTEKCLTKKKESKKNKNKQKLT